MLPSRSEYADLFTAYGQLNSSLLPFSAVQSGLYWSRTDLVPGITAWAFGPVSSGLGGYTVGADVRFFGVAVRPGNVAAAVPEPQTLALALLALGAGRAWGSSAAIWPQRSIFSPAFCPIATVIGLQIRRKLSFLGPNFASTPQARQAPRRGVGGTEQAASLRLRRFGRFGASGHFGGLGGR